MHPFIELPKKAVTKATLGVQMSVHLLVCPSESKTPQPLRIAPIDHPIDN